MNRRTVGLAAALAVVVLAALWVWLRRDAQPESPAAEASAAIEQPEGDGVLVQLFYPGSDGLLDLERRSVFPEEASEGADPNQSSRRLLAAAVVRAVLLPPESPEFFASFEEGTELGSMDFFADGLVLVSLNPPAGSVNRGMGSRAELLRLYSLVNSLAYSVRGVESVLMVWGDSQPQTLGGHVDTTRPIAPSLRWVRDSARAQLQENADGDSEP